MADFSGGSLLGQTFLLADGLRVRLRLARFSDIGAIRALMSLQRDTGDLEAERLVQFDPRRRYVLCATSLMDSEVRFLGIGAIDLDREDVGGPNLLIVDPEAGEPVRSLLSWRLQEAARAAARVRAA